MKKKNEKNIQFIYWNQRRKNFTQSDIAKQYNITRQSVNKSIKLQERDILFRLLDNARSSGILVEWQDAEKGILIGISPQLVNLACIMIIDDRNEIQLFYDQSNNEDEKIKLEIYSKLKILLKNIFQLSIKKEDKFEDIIKKIINEV